MAKFALYSSEAASKMEACLLWSQVVSTKSLHCDDRTLRWGELQVDNGQGIFPRGVSWRCQDVDAKGRIF